MTTLLRPVVADGRGAIARRRSRMKRSRRAASRAVDRTEGNDGVLVIFVGKKMIICEDFPGKQINDDDVRA